MGPKVICFLKHGAKHCPGHLQLLFTVAVPAETVFIHSQGQDMNLGVTRMSLLDLVNARMHLYNIQTCTHDCAFLPVPGYHPPART